MTRPRRPSASSPGWRRRPDAGVLVSVALHVVVVGAMFHAMLEPGRLASWLSLDEKSSPAERIVYVSPPEPVPISAGVTGGAIGPAIEAPAEGRPPLVAPTEVPTRIPDVPAGQAPGVPGGTGVSGGTGSPTRGLRPTYTDPRLWAPTEPARAVRRTPAQQIDSLMASDLGAIRDSAAAVAGARQPGDWTFDRNGRTYGIDQKMIRLGKFSIPTAVLGLLPINTQANPQALQRDRMLSDTRRQLDFVERRQAANASVRSQAQSIRERKDRERELRRARERIKDGGTVADPGGM